MLQAIEDHLIAAMNELAAPPVSRAHVDEKRLLSLFDAQVQSRHLAAAGHYLQQHREGLHLTWPAGHESNAAVALALRPTDPALLHFRSGGFYAARAAQMPDTDPVREALRTMTGSVHDPGSGGRRQGFGRRGMNIVPNASASSSHMPRALGVAFGLGRIRELSDAASWPQDAVAIASFGDATAHHSTVAGALNAAALLAHRNIPLPLLFVCENSERSRRPRLSTGWVGRALSYHEPLEYEEADGTDPQNLLMVADRLVKKVRDERRPAILHLHTVRYGGHSRSSPESMHRTSRDISADYTKDPLLATASLLVSARILSSTEAVARYQAAGERIMAQARRVVAEPHSSAGAAAATERPDTSRRGHRAYNPPPPTPLTLAQTISATLDRTLSERPGTLVFGEDVAHTGGVHGVTRGLQRSHGWQRVFDAPFDQQTILGTALGTALAGFLPIIELLDLAHLHNIGGQLRDETATLTASTDGQYTNGMVVRLPGLAYQRDPDGHIDHSLAGLRDIPGVIVAVPSHPFGAARLLNGCISLAARGRICAFVEPVALYHRQDLFTRGDRGWLAPYAAGETALGSVQTLRRGSDLAIVTFGNGVPMSLRAARTLARRGIEAEVIDLCWLNPLPGDSLFEAVRGFPGVLVADETRRSGGVSESVVACLVDRGYTGALGRVNSADSFVAHGPAADRALLSEDDIVAAVLG